MHATVNSPIVFEQRQGNSEEGEEKKYWEEVLVNWNLVDKALHYVEGENAGCNHSRLASLQTIDTSQNIDGIGAEHCQHTHVNVVEKSCRHHIQRRKTAAIAAGQMDE